MVIMLIEKRCTGVWCGVAAGVSSSLRQSRRASSAAAPAHPVALPTGSALTGLKILEHKLHPWEGFELDELNTRPWPCDWLAGGATGEEGKFYCWNWRFNYRLAAGALC